MLCSGNILVFCGVNLMNLKSMLGGNITSVSSETHVEKVFPQPIFIRLPNATAGNLQGVLLNHRDVFGAIFNANTVALLQSNDEPLAKVGDVQQLRAAIYVLMPPELKK